jgi:hypothetical protein
VLHLDRFESGEAVEMQHSMCGRGRWEGMTGQGRAAG